MPTSLRCTPALANFGLNGKATKDAVLVEVFSYSHDPARRTTWGKFAGRTRQTQVPLLRVTLVRVPSATDRLLMAASFKSIWRQWRMADDGLPSGTPRECVLGQSRGIDEELHDGE